MTCVDRPPGSPPRKGLATDAYKNVRSPRRPCPREEFLKIRTALRPLTVQAREPNRNPLRYLSPACEALRRGEQLGGLPLRCQQPPLASLKSRTAAHQARSASDDAVSAELDGGKALANMRRAGHEKRVAVLFADSETVHVSLTGAGVGQRQIHRVLDAWSVSP